MRNPKKELVNKIQDKEDKFFYNMIENAEAAADEVIRRNQEHGHPAIIHKEDNIVFVDFVTKGQL